MNILLTIIECIYVIYILCFFKTNYSIIDPINYFNNLQNPLFKHSTIQISTEPESKICLFGNYMSYVLAIYFIIRFLMFKKYIIPNISTKQLIYINKIIMLIVLFISLMNINATLYLIPIFILEIIINFRK